MVMDVMRKDLSVLANETFFFLDLSIENLCSILDSGNVRFDKVIWKNHDNVASRGAVGRTHFIVRLPTRIRRTDGSENVGGFVYVWDGSPQRDFVLWVFMCPDNIVLFFDSIFASTLCLLCVSYTATTPRATTPHLYCKGYYAFTTARLPRLCIYIPATTPQVRVSFLGYHT